MPVAEDDQSDGLLDLALHRRKWRREVRGGVEQTQLDGLSALLENVTLSPERDRWWWSLDPNGIFSVKQTRQWVDNVVLPSAQLSTCWNKLVPRKVNILIWRVLLDRIPTRLNLHNRDTLVVRRHPLALRLHRNTKMKAYLKHIDWGKAIATNEIMDGYVMPKYGNRNLLEDDSWIDIIMDDVYDTFYRDEEEEANVAKASEDMNLFIMKEKFLAMVESEKARVKDYTKLVVTDGMVDYGKRKLVEDNGIGKGHDIQNRVGSVEVDLARAIKTKKVDDHDLDTFDLENRIKKLEEDFGRLVKAKKAKESKKAREAKKAKESELAKKARDAELKENKAKKAKEEELKAKNAKEAKKRNADRIEG
nr:RNA-directed DNA polymerase, eukaryota [Tanacetum cinerariifolium]